MSTAHPLALLQQAVKRGALRSVDLHLARHLLEQATPQHATGQDAQTDAWVALAIAMLSRANADGDVCIDLAALAAPAAGAGHARDTNTNTNTNTNTANIGITPPPLIEWETALLASGLVGMAQHPKQSQQQRLPLMLDTDHRLYLYRYWLCEQSVAAALRARAIFVADIDTAALRAELVRWFADRAPDDGQQLGAAVAVLRQFTVISGGPGTGKTTTVARILALLLALATDGAPPVIRLAAPTGKAAARLSQSIRLAKENLRQLSAAGTTTTTLQNKNKHTTLDIINAIPETTTTLHRLLGMRGDRRSFAHDADNPLALDVLLVDEASMIDLTLMSRLLAALPPHARLILLGDRDQLAAVEAGNVLGDLCQTDTWSDDLRARLRAAGLVPPSAAATAVAFNNNPLADSLVVLEKSHRFDQDSGIGRLAAALRDGRSADVLALCSAAATAATTTENTAAIQWQSPDETELAGLIDAEISAHIAADRENRQRHNDPVSTIARFDKFRFLCAVRDGPFGVAHINQRVEAALTRRGLIDPRAGQGASHYAGQPLLITRNDYRIPLFNGDVGLVLPDEEAGGALCAFFVQPDGRIRRVALNRLPAHETAWAMTVHKSQGSEFERVVVILPAAPADQEHPLLTREMLYTAITRARSSVAIWSSRAALEQAIRNRVTRTSGLRAALHQS